jgi:hypothetical protein
MEFRWIALLALWTLLSGPAFYSPSSQVRQRERPTVRKTSPPRSTAPALTVIRPAAER